MCLYCNDGKFAPLHVPLRIHRARVHYSMKKQICAHGDDDNGARETSVYMFRCPHIHGHGTHETKLGGAILRCIVRGDHACSTRGESKSVQYVRLDLRHIVAMYRCGIVNNSN